MEGYVLVFQWEGDVASLPSPKSVTPVFGGVQRAVTRALNPIQVARYFFQRYAGDLCVYIGQRLYTLQFQ